MWTLIDALRQARGHMLGAAGFGPAECDYRVVTSAPGWRLREYGDAQPSQQPLLIVAAPIKRPYIWDFAPKLSAVRYCLDRGLRVYMLEWIPPERADDCRGLDAYADQAIGACVASISGSPHGQKPFLIGHSLGGTLATIFAALNPQSLRGLVLLGAPLCFDQKSSRFRDAVVDMAPANASETGIVPGWVLSQCSALASPDTFVWSRFADIAMSIGEPSAMDLHTRVERWVLDEVPLSGRLVNQILAWLYRENRLCRGILRVANKWVGPSSAEVPVLAVVNADDEVAPTGAVAPFLEAMPTKDVRLIEHPGERGVGLQHLAILIGRRAYADVWPQIIGWIDGRR
jgi:polyhydroxyalkanoate synthase subunit PhaC